MASAHQAIKLTRFADRWTWAVVDGQGETSASGVVRDQMDAMETAWRTARSFANGPRTVFPDIIVEQSRPEH